MSIDEIAKWLKTVQEVGTWVVLLGSAIWFIPKGIKYGWRDIMARYDRSVSRFDTMLSTYQGTADANIAAANDRHANLLKQLSEQNVNFLSAIAVEGREERNACDRRNADLMLCMREHHDAVLREIGGLECHTHTPEDGKSS